MAAEDLTREQMEEDLDQMTDIVRRAWAYYDDQRAGAGVDVDAIHAEMKGCLDSIRSSSEFILLLHEYIGALKDGDAATYPESTPAQSSRYWPLGVSQIDEGILIYAIGGDIAERTGLEIGDLILEVDGRPVEDLIQEKSRHVAASTGEARMYSTLTYNLGLTDSESMELTIRRGDLEPFQVRVPTYPIGMVRRLPEGAWGGFLVRRRMEDEIGYIRVGTFQPGPRKAERGMSRAKMMALLEEARASIRGAFADLQGTKALILDVRGNTGGIDPVGMYLAKHLLKTPCTYYELQTRWSPDLDNVLEGKQKTKGWSSRRAQELEGDESIEPYEGRLIVLINSACSGAVDRFLSCIADLREDAIFVGRPTAGAPGNDRRLATLGHSRAVLSLPVSKVWSPRGRLIKGVGTKPDTEVRWTREDFLEDNDPDLEVALREARKYAPQGIKRPRRYVISGVTVIDVEKGVAVPARTVRITGDTIEAINPASEEEGAEDATNIDARGLYLIPGLFDAHAHYWKPETYGPLFVSNGVTFVRDMGGVTYDVLTMRRRLARGELLGPEMIVTGAILDGEAMAERARVVCETPEEGRVAVRKHAEKGVEQIKVYSRLRKDVYHAICEEAKELDLKVVGHVPESVGLEEAVEAGQVSTEHLDGWAELLIRLAEEEAGETRDRPSEAPRELEMCPNIKPESWPLLAEVAPERLGAFIDKVKASGMVICPTLVVWERMSRLNDPDLRAEPLLDYVPFSLRSYWGRWLELSPLREALPHMKSLVSRLDQAGVPIVCGTDQGAAYIIAGYSLHDEMELLQGAGLSPAAVLRAATVDPARLCDVDGRLGTVAEGKTASLVLLRRDPLEDVRHAREIAGVFLRGEYYDRQRLNGLLESVKDAVKAGAPRKISEEELILQGELVAKGRYRIWFNRAVNSVEDFLVTRTEDGYLLKARHQDLYGARAPHLTKARFGLDFAFGSAEMFGQQENPVTTTCLVEGNLLSVKVERNAETIREETRELEGNPVFHDPANSALLFFQLEAMSLEVGETRTLRTISLNPRGSVSVARVVLGREPDTRVRKMDGEDLELRHYKLEGESGKGSNLSEIWTDMSGRILKLETALDSGIVEIRSEELDADRK